MRTAVVSPKFVVRTVLAGVVVVGVVAGCSPTKDGTPTTEVSGKPTSGEKTVQYNPCKELSDEALRATKVDPASKDVTTDAPTGPVSARVCQWTSTEGPYYVSVSSTIYSQDDARKNDKLTGFRDVRIGSRAGLVYQDKSDEDKLRCYANLPWSKGMFEVTVGWQYSERASMPQSPPCDLAVRHAQELEPYLPK
ncbi:uncharacterized protein DUF3558 [Nocardia tenerifensis]|uniref:Uncharacterized protein DUF3558 n=1 Tax=Nocardia tenerifensis TaxID=228006 RepID=A0A318K0I4_9NOCA|nr:DUF3558 domain-containing protein [Nocardia tenerifensis]PXX61461.1 uncharacterized protein DUF3558 [Nocardia tenerifensis]